MSRVFVAEELSLGRKVVVKVLPPDLAATVNVERFRREIQLAAKLQHPHIVPVLAAGISGGLPYYTMPFIEGESLRARLARTGELPVQEAARILRDVLSALSYAHEHGVVHRDIKPDNVLLTGNHAVVADFGVAKALSASTNPGSSLTSLGVALGTPAYMSPEQAAADPTTDHRADLYGVGAMAYEMLTGQQVFSARSPQAMLAAHVSQRPEAIDVRRPSVPREVSSLIMRSLEKHAADRPQSAAEMLAQLEAAVTPSGATSPHAGLAPTGARPALAPPVARTTAPTPSRQAAWIIGVVVVIAAIVVATLLNSRTAKAGGRIETIGVMPIEDISGSDSVFAASMHDALTIALSRPGNVGVAPRTVMMRYRGTSLTTRDIARQNNLDAIVEATVFRAGDVVRINVQFTNPVTSRALWSETYERNAQNVLATENEVAGMIASAVGAAIRGRRQ